MGLSLTHLTFRFRIPEPHEEDEDVDVEDDPIMVIFEAVEAEVLL